ncbi:MAG: hypothetical protein QF441_10195 [Bacteriovoracaceae bacterium]|nr:hypothetical protein [Bacteriovoracaceae bacterium]
MRKKYSFVKIFIIIFMLNIFSSCLPEQQVRTNPLEDQNSEFNNPDNSSNDKSTQLPEEVNFLQLNDSRSTGTLNLFSNYSDSFLLRGNQLMETIKDNIPQGQTNLCLISFFPNISGPTSNSILISSARIRSYYNGAIKAKEYFLQIEPNNETINQGDCLTVSLTNKIQSDYPGSQYTFKLEKVCPTCNVSINSDGLQLYSPLGTKEKSIKISHLRFQVLPAVGSPNNEAPKVCSINANCTSLNFNCCLAGQCVNHGEVRSEVDTNSDKYKVAVELISARPELINNYQDVFYVCPEMVPSEGSSPSEPEDPLQDAADLLNELEDLYNCTTPQVDEFSICPKEYPNASTLMQTSAYNFSVEGDDINFTSITAETSRNNIVGIHYAGEVLYKEKLLNNQTQVPLASGITFLSPNDNLTQAQQVSIQRSLPVNAINDTVKLYYKVNGTCERLGSSLARCKKFYKQGQSSTPPRSSDHPSGSQVFSLPDYADTGFNIIVKIGGSPIAQGSETWSLVGKNIIFNSNDFPIYNNQEIEITYFVSTNVLELTKSKHQAQEKINQHCKCDPNESPCTLEPVKTTVAGVEKVTSYICKYPEADAPEIPLQQTVYVNAKSVPHKFYSSSGVNFDLESTPSVESQEGEIFEYTDGNNLKPNNLDKHIGFNEIYGSMNIDAASPLPPKTVSLTKGKNYDIFVDEGAFSTCLNCGTDYFSSLQKIFPNNFDYKGAGYLPDMVESRRISNKSDYRADDLRFGRACFVPATMIPWTHKAHNSVIDQRRNRLAAQHFLFSNGYNRDWYGFDYGALIGSFDGVKWFAIGNQRRIKATGEKLYLAVNAYFGDLTINNSFKVTINEMNSALNSGSSITHDTDNDGAQCQKAHYCSTDDDCIAQLGYDYTCQNVSGIQTPWPQFDAKGNELSGSLQTSLLSLVGGSNGQAKRCVYRGRGSLCHPQNFQVSANNSYMGSSTVALHTCSSNTTCQSLNQQVFNTKIARFAESPLSQNIQSFVTDKTDTFGLGARNLGRPYNFYGNEQTPNSIRAHLSDLNVNALCVPGKDIETANSTSELNYLNTQTREADKVANVGRTLSSAIFQDPKYLAACPATDESGNFTHLNNTLLTSNEHNPYAINDNISSNLLNLNALKSLNIFNDNNSLVTQKGYQKNTCLRAPGAKCFSDFECAPSEYLATRFKSISNFNGEINEAEERFWEEGLICANSQPRYQENSIYPNPLYETNEHKCCRDTGKEFTYYTQKHENSIIETVDNAGNPLIPGVNQDYNSPKRYSRTNTVYDKMLKEPGKYPPLYTPASQPNSPLNMTLTKLRQYNTLHLHNERMCCTGHWVRKFASGTNANNGGHSFDGNKQQNIPIETFKPLSWNPNHVPALNTFPSSVAYDPTLLTYTCTTEDYVTADCEVKNIIEGSTVEKKYLNWFSKFELIGIPQVLIETNNVVEKPLSTDTIDIDNDGIDDYQEQEDISALKLPLDNTIKDVNSDGVVDAIYNGKEYYSASSYDNFEIGSGKLKKIFSENEFNCCIPTGFEVTNTTTDNQCCTGKVATINDQTRCCLQDFADLSVYTNRYVSSEGAHFNGQPIRDSDIDPTSGYIKKEIVLQMASTMCCSGKATYGSVINDFLIPIDYDKKYNCAKTRRWLYLASLDNDEDVDGGVSKYNAGLKWNNHVYCVPEDFEESLQTCSGGGSGGGSGAVGSP